MNLNRSSLINLCCQGSSSCTAGLSTGGTKYSDSTGLPLFLNFTEGYVGIYGDADPLDATQWSAITHSVPSPARSWSDKTSTCSGMFTGLNIEFLVTASGEKANPQNKIVASRAEVTTKDWVFNIPSGDLSSTQTFALTTTVSFVFREDNILEGYEPPAPPVLFEVPYDVFYPFLKVGVQQRPKNHNKQFVEYFTG
eukprot:gene40624-50259_t